MKLLPATLILTLAVGASAVQETDTARFGMQVSAETEEHKWLQQLVGDWTTVGDVNAGPGGEAMRYEGSEHSRALGELWIISEVKSSMDGVQFDAVMTVGSPRASSVHPRLATARRCEDARRSFVANAMGIARPHADVTPSPAQRSRTSVCASGDPRSIR